MYSYWVQTGRDFIDFTGKRKPELKKLTHFKTIKDVEKHFKKEGGAYYIYYGTCLLYTSPSPRDVEESRMPSSA